MGKSSLRKNIKFYYGEIIFERQFIFLIKMQKFLKRYGSLSESEEKSATM